MIRYVERPVTPVEFNFLRTCVGWHEFDVEGMGRSLEKCLYSLVVFDDDELIGMGRVIGDERIDLFIKDVIVIPGYQGRGIGHGIMERIMAFANSVAIDKTNVALMSAPGKEAFYRKYGFLDRPNDHQGAGMNLKIRKPRTA